MNRTIKDATVKRCDYDRHDQLGTHLQLFVEAYNHARRLKTLRGQQAIDAAKLPPALHESTAHALRHAA